MVYLAVTLAINLMYNEIKRQLTEVNKHFAITFAHVWGHREDTGDVVVEKRLLLLLAVRQSIKQVVVNIKCTRARVGTYQTPVANLTSRLGFD